MKKLYLLSLIAMFLISCGSDTTSEDKIINKPLKPQKKLVEIQKPFKWSYLKEIPQQMDGFSCVLYENDTSQIIMADEGNIAYISINDSVYSLDLINAEDTTSKVSIFKNNDIIITKKYVQSEFTGDESSKVKCNISLKKNGIIIEKSVFGYCSF